MPTPMLLTLTPGVGVLTEPTDIVPYIIRHVLATPGESTTYFQHVTFSFRELEMQYGKDPELLADKLQEAFNIIFSKYFSGSKLVNTTCNTEMIDDERYNLTILVTDISGINIITSSKIEIDKNHKMKINFD